MKPKPKTNPRATEYSEAVVSLIRSTYSGTVAVYLYGTWGTEHQREDSDLDIAVLLPHEEAKQADSKDWRQLAADIAREVRVEHADLINLRRVNTSFQAEILSAERLIFSADETERLKFEALILRMYQDLNFRRAKIREEIIKSGRVFADGKAQE